MIPSRLFAPLILSVGFVLGACNPSNIPNTDVEDTGQNRKVITFCEVYRHAVEEKNVGQLLKLASERYHEDGGNSDAYDDIDFEGLRGFLTNQFNQTNQIRYEIRYRKVTFTETNHVYVDYTFAASYKIPGVKGDEWKHSVADNRLDLVPDGDNYKIMSGM